jgi:lactate racemase
MTRFLELPWGKGSLQVKIPDSWRILGELRPNTIDSLDKPEDECGRSLAEPIGAGRLSSRNLTGKRVLIVVDDHSRPTPVSQLIRPILEELSGAGVHKKDIEFLIATGVNRASRTEEVAKKLGASIMSEYLWSCHDAYDSQGLADLGTTARGTRVFLNKRLLLADLIVCVGAVEPHLLLGFGGGLKMILPGCAGADTIGKNHMQGVDPDHFDYVGTSGENSPMRQDLEEGAHLLRKEIFIVNAAMNEHAQPAKFFCGDPVKAHRMGERFIADLVRMEIPEQADVVMANSFPMDADLRQSVKCIGNSLYASKPGGIMMGFARAENGLGEMPLAKKTLPYPVMRALLKVIGKNRVLPLVEKAKSGEPVEEVFVGDFGLQMLRRYDLVIFSDSPKLPADIGRKMGLARSFTDTPTMMSWVASKAPKRATAWVFPCGGATYATFGDG